MRWSRIWRREVNPGPLSGAPVTGLGEFQIANAGIEIGLDGGAGNEMAEEIFPADAIRIPVRTLSGDLCPMLAIVDAEIGRDAEVSGARHLHVGLNPATVQPRNRRSAGTINLEGEQIVAAQARGPRTGDGAGDTAFELDQGGNRVLDIDTIARASFVDALGRRGGQRNRHAANPAEQSLDHVTPMRKHIEHEAAAILAPVIPARPLAGLRGAVKNPPAEFNAKTGDAAEKIARRKTRELHEAG